MLIKSSLEDLPGIGKVKRQELLKTFGSIKNLKNSTDAEILDVKGISAKDLKNLRTLS